MPTKALNINQHDVLHQHYPNDCCLCKAESKIKELENRVYELYHHELENFSLKKDLAEIKDKLSKDKLDDLILKALQTFGKDLKVDDIASMIRKELNLEK